MAITPTLRFLLKQYGSGGDPHPNRTEFNAMIDAIENNAAMFAQGITSARPGAGKRGRFYWDETVSRLYYDNGANWKDANPNGGGGAGLALAIGGAGSEGVSDRAARADHTHPLPLATSAAPGAMSAADKAKLDAGTDVATANALARRDANGRISVNTPTAAAHAATKGYADSLAVQNADYVDQQVGPGLTITRYAPASPLNYSVAGDIWAISFVNGQLITGNLAIKRTGADVTITGGSVIHTPMTGAVIPAAIRDTRPGNEIAGLANVTNLIGQGQFEKIQTLINQGDGTISVRADTAAGLNWRTGTQINVSFSYIIGATP
jgi:hypothetical protein